ncbi:hypothetical protein DPMN_034780 [Dreissena polymorpha]|uniref:Uncharacterized protein n=1 Tax=Dreissena polymorpha TaxID=45954 RepID=A0A9D4RMD6_DREPO|nr:hypothetical protein DPMN_034780 [Dreissena polymorpha]
MDKERTLYRDRNVRSREGVKERSYARTQGRDQARPYPKKRSPKLDRARTLQRDRTPDRTSERSSEKPIAVSYSPKRDIPPCSVPSKSREEREYPARSIISGRQLPPLRVTVGETEDLQPPRKVRKIDTHLLTRNERRRIVNCLFLDVPERSNTLRHMCFIIMFLASSRRVFQKLIQISFKAVSMLWRW